MPLGDPMGEETPYVEGGRLERVWMTSVPVRHLGLAVEFYTCILGLELQLDSRDKNWVEVGPDDPQGKIGLYVPARADDRQPGGDTGVIFSTDSIFELHRKLVDEGVRFELKPEKRPWGGLMAIFLDQDGNKFTVVEDPDHYLRGPKPKQPERASTRETERSCRMAQR